MSAGEVAYLILVLGAAGAFVAILGYVSVIAGPPKEPSERSGSPSEAGAADDMAKQPT